MPTLLRELKRFYAERGRHALPWRKTRDPYNILVSEVMLQQTQVERVIPFYKHFLREFPTARALAKAPLSQVLRAWTGMPGSEISPYCARHRVIVSEGGAISPGFKKSPERFCTKCKMWRNSTTGLGYNRRAKFLHEAAKKMASAETRRENSLARERSERDTGDPRTFSRRVSAPLCVEFLESLPGVGHYTARAVAAFAYNSPEVFIETNIRTVFLHHLFHSHILKNMRISDAELLPLVEKVFKQSKMEPREFYAALMDYGAHLKRNGVRLNARSAHYVKQKKFEGSARQLRGALLRELLNGPQTLGELAKKLSPRKRGEVERELARLSREGMVVKRATRWRVV